MLQLSLLRMNSPCRATVNRAPASYNSFEFTNLLVDQLHGDFVQARVHFVQARTAVKTTEGIEPKVG